MPVDATDGEQTQRSERAFLTGVGREPVGKGGGILSHQGKVVQASAKTAQGGMEG